jgi:predicted acetyltransferase
MPDLSLVPASHEDRPVIERLIQLYLYDMASQSPWPIGQDGLYAYDMLDPFWQHPYLIRSDGNLAGFALVIVDCPLTGRSPCWFMAEFFVLGPNRRSGLGRAAVDAILSHHPGTWHIANLTSNAPADAFWSKVVPKKAYDAIPIPFDGDTWNLRSFSV